MVKGKEGLIGSTQLPLLRGLKSRLTRHVDEPLPRPLPYALFRLRRCFTGPPRQRPALEVAAPAALAVAAAQHLAVAVATTLPPHSPSLSLSLSPSLNTHLPTVSTGSAMLLSAPVVEADVARRRSHRSPP
ncbi:hypothetical protein GALMADRAFT_146659 [Galerina marginata CBS 339.88]|uniref:Uncharacterized protein n=1 Tax=Galerina marginata (strain CBS 339.88) TaxID=685588 RepID=A0A067SD61_GALM3|nr:hypothetical protein GALMADRAFT_146659 [Galerina marginata CBS 339.88]